MPGPAATVGSMHVCPMCSGTVPHVGGPIIGPGEPTVLIGGKPAAVMGDNCVCVGPPDVIAQGEATVLIGGKPAVTVGAMTAHGGSITAGEPTVLIGTGSRGGATATMARKKIPFPKIKIINKTIAVASGNGKTLKEAQTNQEKLKKAAESTEGEPKIYGIRWLKDEAHTKESMVETVTKVSARTRNIPDGETITFKINIPSETEGGEPKIIEVTGTVQNNKVESEWTSEPMTPNNN